jgi:ferredoxin-NADP reductase
MKRYPSKISDIKLNTPSVLDLTLVSNGATTFPEFAPGQYATLSFPQHPRLRGERSFSILSAPTNLKTMRFGIRMHGRYTSELKTLRPGDPVMVAMPYGSFTFDPLRDRSAVFLAGGIGVTPFLSMIKYATDNKLPNDLLLLYSFRSTGDAPFLTEITRLTVRNPHLNTVMAVSDNRLPEAAYQYVPGRITAEVLARALEGKIAGRTFMVCGPPPFMSSMSELLKRLGLSKSDIRTERFSVGSSALVEPGTPMPALAFATWGIVAAIFFGVVLQKEQSKRDKADSAFQATVPEVLSNNQNKNTNPNNTNQAANAVPAAKTTPSTKPSTAQPPVTPNPTAPVNRTPTNINITQPTTPPKANVVQPKPTPAPAPTPTPTPKPSPKPVTKPS